MSRDARETFANFGKFWSKQDVDTAAKALRDNFTKHTLAGLCVQLQRNASAILDKLAKTEPGFTKAPDGRYICLDRVLGPNQINQLDRMTAEETAAFVYSEGIKPVPLEKTPPAPQDLVLYTRYIETIPVIASFNYEQVRGEGEIRKEIIDMGEDWRELWDRLSVDKRAILLRAFEQKKLTLFEVELNTTKPGTWFKETSHE